MTSRTALALAVAVVVSNLTLSGCGEGGPKLVPVSGTVTLNGKPMKDAAILFLPDDANKEGQPAQDQTGPEGNYKAMTLGRSGVVPGKYKVVISRANAAAVASKIPDAFKDDPFMGRLATEGPAPASGQAANASKASEIKQEFDAEVSPSGSVLDFDVKAEVPKS